MNKREFLASTLALAGSELALGNASAAPAMQGSSAGLGGRLPPVDDGHGLARWQRYVGQSFTVDSGEASSRVNLEAVDVHALSSAQVEQFSLRFAMKSSRALPSGTYSVRHDSGQRFALTLDASPDQTGYQAHFSLLV